MTSIVLRYLCTAPAASTLTRLLAKGSLRGIHSSACNMAIKVGDKVPAIDLYEGLPTKKINLSTETVGTKVILFGVPGAFTPGCSKTHLPGYISNAESFKESGVDKIFCISINDPFVMAAWGEAHGAENKVRMLADTNGLFTKELGLTQDLPGLGGVRSKRYSMVVEDSIVTSLNVEPDGVGLTCSLANNLVVKP